MVKSGKKWGKMAKSGEKRPFWIPIFALYSMSVATSNMKLIGAFLIKL